MESVYVFIPDAADLAPGDRTAYAVAHYRHCLNGVFLYSGDARGPNTWDVDGHPFALERALFADVYAEPVAPCADCEVSASVLEALVRCEFGV